MPPPGPHCTQHSEAKDPGGHCAQPMRPLLERRMTPRVGRPTHSPYTAPPQWATHPRLSAPLPSPPLSPSHHKRPTNVVT
eukprot:5044288-Prymnesium_polylepis.1